MKVALVTGASGGIGIEITKKFINNNFFVIAQYNNNYLPLEKIKNKNNKFYNHLYCYKCDFNNIDNINDFCSYINNDFKHIDVLINNVGMTLHKMFVDTDLNEFDKIFNINLRSFFLITKYVLNNMMINNGNIINISSIQGLTGASCESIYAATKSSLISFTKSLAKELSSSNINVNCILPGIINTKMNNNLSLKDIQQIKKDIPMRKLGTAKDIANLIYFIATKCKYMTGSSIVIDGGYSL